ncbi:MAG: hypothetical protein ACKVJK_09655, partial [Methylophagaceae bacterium]
NQTIVFLNGVYQFKGTYTLSGTTLTLDTAPSNGVSIEVMSIGSAYSGGDILYDHDFTSAGLMTSNGSGVYSITTNNSANWNTAYGWGDHELSAQDKTDIGNLSGTNTGDQDLSSYATQSYVGTQITNLVDSSPATLNTLNELAAALGDDPNFATTTATSIGTKMPLTGGTFTGDVNLLKTLNSAVTSKVTNPTTGRGSPARFVAVTDGGNIQLKSVSIANTTYGAGDAGVINCDTMSGGFRIAHNDVTKYTLAFNGENTWTGGGTFGGSVGIGAAPLQGKLDILNNGDYDAHTGHGLTINSNASNAYTSMYIGADDSVDAAYIQSAGRNTSFTTKKLLLQPNGGNVGIGTTSLTNSSGYNTLSISGTTGGQIAFQTSGVGKHYIYSTGTDFDIYNGQAGNLKLFTNSAERMRIDSSGNVGIGTTVVTAPGFWYDATNNYLAISHWATPPTPAALLHLSDNANDIDVPQIRIEGRENPGDTKLDISVKDPDVRFNLIENTPDANAGYGLMIFKTNAVANSTNPARGGFNFQTPASSSSLFITNEANVGIGTSSPERRLVLDGTLGTASLEIKQNSDRIVYLGTGSSADNVDQPILLLYDAGAIKVNISSIADSYFNGGNVGIGTTSPDNKLQVVAGNAQVQAWFGETSYTNAAVRIGGENAAGGRMYIQYDGDNSYIDSYGGHGSTQRYRDLTIAARNIKFVTGNTSGSEKVRITEAGGITFNGDTASANALDDYEEGTWTPTISHNNGTGVIPLTVNSATYVKVGKIVHVRAYLTSINPNGNAGGSGVYYAVRSLPFTASADGAWEVVYANTNMTSYGGYWSGNNLYFMHNGTNGQRSSIHVNGTHFNAFGANASFMIQAVYTTT